MTPYETYKKAVEEALPKPPQCCNCSDGALCFWHLQIKALRSLTLALLDGEMNRIAEEIKYMKTIDTSNPEKLALVTGYLNALDTSLSHLRSEREKIANEN